MNSTTTRGWTLQPIVAGLVAILAGYSGSIVIVFQAAQAAHLPDALVSSWVWAISLGCGLSGIALSLITRAPISVAWSTQGAALLVLSLLALLVGCLALLPPWRLHMLPLYLVVTAFILAVALPVPDAWCPTIELV